MNSISKNEMNIRISLCYVRCVNGQWNVGHFSGNRSEKDALTEKKDSKYLGNNYYRLEIFNFAM